MSGVNYNLNNYNTYTRVPFRAKEQGGLEIVTKPIDKVENIVNTTVDTFVPETQDEEKKKSHKTAIRVGSTVLVLSAIVALFNPKFSSNLVNKLKTKATKAGNKAKVNNSFWGAWNKFKVKVFDGITNVIQILNNVNSTKDELFQKLCNKNSISKKIHQSITKGFDKISKQTVYGKYNSALKQMNTFEEILKHYKDRLSQEEKVIFEKKLAEIDKFKEYFNSANTKNRLKAQEDLMQNLENDVSNKIVQAKDTVMGKITGKKIENEMKIKDTCTFWAEDSLMSKRNQLEKDGLNVINSLVGDGKTQKGAYQEVIEILHLSTEEKQAFDDSIKQAGKLLRKANTTECVEYFDKKRDLMLGSAPTDILTAVVSLLASGIAIGTADSKEDRLSRTISGALPVVAGLGVSTALTAMLFSGGKGMALGSGSGMVLSALGSGISHKLFPKDKGDLLTAENKNEKVEKGEVKNV